MKERPILFSGEMVRAILAGRKTMTRRIVTPQPPIDYLAIGSGYVGADQYWTTFDDPANAAALITAKCPYGKPGSRLWVKETWAIDFEKNILYRATDESPSSMGTYGAKKIVDGVPSVWRPSIFMPRAASRLTLEITAVRAERLQDITEEDAKAEGVVVERAGIDRSFGEAIAIAQFRILWDQINAKRAPWSSNPWVWVVEFKRVEVSNDPHAPIVPHTISPAKCRPAPVPQVAFSLNFNPEN